MSDHDPVGAGAHAPAVARAAPASRLGFSRRAALAGGGAAALSAVLAACGKSSDDSEGGTGAGNFPETPAYRFVFVNHVTTNPFFVPTQYGAEDASALLNTKFQWTGSKTSDVGEMVNAMNTAITGKADGIAVALVDTKAFNGPTQKALEAGIPVVSYNADATSNDRRASRSATPPTRSERTGSPSSSGWASCSRSATGRRTSPRSSAR